VAVRVSGNFNIKTTSALVQGISIASAPEFERADMGIRSPK
jgi:hypothetical protein